MRRSHPEVYTPKFACRVVMNRDICKIYQIAIAYARDTLNIRKGDYVVCVHRLLRYAMKIVLAE